MILYGSTENDRGDHGLLWVRLHDVRLSVTTGDGDWGTVVSTHYSEGMVIESMRSLPEKTRSRGLLYEMSCSVKNVTHGRHTFRVVILEVPVIETRKVNGMFYS